MRKFAKACEDAGGKATTGVANEEDSLDADDKCYDNVRQQN